MGITRNRPDASRNTRNPAAANVLRAARAAPMASRRQTAAAARVRIDDMSAALGAVRPRGRCNDTALQAIRSGAVTEATLARLVELAPAAICDDVAESDAVQVGAQSRIPTAVLAQATTYADPETDKLAASHPNCPPSVLRRLTRRRDFDPLLGIAQTEACPPMVMRAMGGHYDPLTRWALTRNAMCPADTLARLADDSDRDIRAGVAARQACPPAALELLCEDEQDEVRAAAATNQRCPPRQLGWLAEDPWPDVRSAAAAALRLRADSPTRH